MTKQRGPKTRAADPVLSVENLSVVRSKRLRSTKSRRALATGTADIEELSKSSVRVALYLRVSTSRSVESNLSIPQQEKQLRSYCKDRGWIVVAVYVEEGKSAKTTNRPQFRMMVEDAQALQRPFDTILIWTTSRFARSSNDYAIVENLLRRHGIDVLSVSQRFAKDAGGLVAKRVSTMFDEFHSTRSAEDSINARHQMVENGWWPGGRPPEGYKLVPASNHPGRKVAVIDEDRRPIIERIYTLALHGDGDSAPMGVKAISMWLNGRNLKTRKGARWGIQAIHRILTNPAYFGDYYWGMEPAVSEFREEKEPALLKIPPTISRAMFEDTQLLLQRRDPKMGAAKQVSSPLLLSQIARCEECGAAMTLRTGKGGAYRYYHCSSATRGKMVCSGPSIPEKVLDDTVLTAVRSRVLDKDHLISLISGFQRRERARATSATEELPSLRSRVLAAETAIEGMWASLRVAPSLEKDPLYTRNLRRAADELELARARLDQAVSATSDIDKISDAAVAQFRSEMIKLLEDQNKARTKIYLSSIVQRVEVGASEIRIEGHIDDLRRAVVSSDETSGEPGRPEVRRYVRRWRRERDSNPRYGFP